MTSAYLREVFQGAVRRIWLVAWFIPSGLLLFLVYPPSRMDAFNVRILSQQLARWQFSLQQHPLQMLISSFLCYLGACMMEAMSISLATREWKRSKRYFLNTVVGILIVSAGFLLTAVYSRNIAPADCSSVLLRIGASAAFLAPGLTGALLTLVLIFLSIGWRFSTSVRESMSLWGRRTLEILVVILLACLISSVLRPLASRIGILLTYTFPRWLVVGSLIEMIVLEDGVKT